MESRIVGCRIDIWLCSAVQCKIRGRRADWQKQVGNGRERDGASDDGEGSWLVWLGRWSGSGLFQSPATTELVFKASVAVKKTGWSRRKRRTV